jgi:hypothetical protein
MLNVCASLQSIMFAAEIRFLLKCIDSLLRTFIHSLPSTPRLDAVYCTVLVFRCQCIVSIRSDSLDNINTHLLQCLLYCNHLWVYWAIFAVSLCIRTPTFLARALDPFEVEVAIY